MLKNGTAAEPDFDLDEYNCEIDEAEYERDGGYSHEEVMTMFKDKRSKDSYAR